MNSFPAFEAGKHQSFVLPRYDPETRLDYRIESARDVGFSFYPTTNRRWVSVVGGWREQLFFDLGSWIGLWGVFKE